MRVSSGAEQRPAGACPLKILILEGEPADATLMERALRRGGADFAAKRVRTRAALAATLDTFRPEVLLADTTLPDLSVREALHLVRERHPEVPVIIVTDALGEQEAVKLLKAGARDYVLKCHVRGLPAAVARAIDVERGIRARKAAEAEHRRLARIVEDAADGILSRSVEGVITAWNKGAERLFGYSAAEAIGQSISLILPPDRRDEQQALDRNAHAGEEARNFETVRRHKSGRPVDVALTLSPVRDAAGAIVGTASIYRDISERKRAEAELRAAARYARSLIEASLDPLVTISPEGRITDVNEATTKITGVSRGQLIGSDFSGYFTEPERAREGYRKVFAEGFVSNYPLSIRHTSGKIANVLYNASVYRNEAGTVAGVFTAARDITERKRAEAELHRYREGLEQIVEERTAALSDANEKLEAANQELEAFSYSVSHDLRAPLRAIDGFSRILLEDYADKLDGEGQRILNVVRDGAIKMARLIDDILAFSRAGRTGMNPVTVDMEGLVRAVLAEPLAPALAGRTVTIDIAKLPPAQGDRAMLERVWTNLLDNAIKFTAPAPHARIEIAAAQGDGETVYSVRDNGVGFDMTYAGKLFGVFQRLHGSSEFSGTGIGLAIVKRIVARHGGRVWAEGKPGDGAAFYFALPHRETGNAG